MSPVSFWCQYEFLLFELEHEINCFHTFNNPIDKYYSKTESKTELIISLFDSDRTNNCFPSVWTMCLHNFSISSTPRIESVDSFKQFSYWMSNSSLSISPFSITGCHFVSITSFSWDIRFLENDWFWKRSRSFLVRKRLSRRSNREPRFRTRKITVILNEFAF